MRHIYATLLSESTISNILRHLDNRGERKLGANVMSNIADPSRVAIVGVRESDGKLALTAVPESVVKKMLDWIPNGGRLWHFRRFMLQHKPWHRGPYAMLCVRAYADSVSQFLAKTFLVECEDPDVYVLSDVEPYVLRYGPPRLVTSP